VWAVSLARAQAKFPWLDARLRAPARIVARADALNKWAGRPRAQMGLHPPPAAQMLPHPLPAPRIQEGAQHPVRLGLGLAQQREGLVVPGQVRVRADESWGCSAPSIASAKPVGPIRPRLTWHAVPQTRQCIRPRAPAGGKKAS